jgi:hypothetical protein
MFKEMMADLMRKRYGVGLRRDLLNEQQKQQERWKGPVALIDDPCKN